MSDLIQLLPEHIANQIAAGEVIQRPASVIKELMENALDADATKIDVVIKDAGKTLIQVVDNGKGMSKSDAQLCFARHATSKVRQASDLFALTTKGFRGEALASIAAIAHVTLRTKETDAELGNLIQIEGSEIKTLEEVVCPVGTSFEVKNLFFNVPARRNFLKSTEVEYKHLKDEFERVALAHPNVEFTLTNNGLEVYHLPIVVLRKRIVDLINDKYNERLVPIEANTEIVQVHGFVVKPEFAKKSRGEQFLFVNDRFFKDGFFHHAITKAFEGLIQPRTFPGYFLYFTIDPSKIDVNVHPTKTEIKFEEDRFIYSILVSSIRQALGKYNIAPTLDFERETSFDLPSQMRNQPVVEPSIRVNTAYNPFDTSSTSNSSSSKANVNSAALQSNGFGVSKSTQEDWQNFYGGAVEVENEAEAQEIEFQNELEATKQYLVRMPYIFTPTKSGIMVIHSKRAYERIVYTDLMQRFVSQPIASQTLLFPYEKEVSSAEVGVWQENQMLLNRLGFSGEVKDDLLEVSAIPTVLQLEAVDECLDMILNQSAYKEIEKGDIAHFLISSIAKNASKTEVALSNNESIQSLIEQLFQCEEHVFTPTGKTIVKSIPLEEIHQKF